MLEKTQIFLEFWNNREQSKWNAHWSEDLRKNFFYLKYDAPLVWSEFYILTNFF